MLKEDNLGQVFFLIILLFPVKEEARPPFVRGLQGLEKAGTPSPFQRYHCGTSLVVQWFRLCTSTAGGAGSIPGPGTKIPHALQCGQKLKKKKESKDSVEPCLCSWHLAPRA